MTRGRATVRTEQHKLKECFNELFASESPQKLGGVRFFLLLVMFILLFLNLRVCSYCRKRNLKIECL